MNPTEWPWYDVVTDGSIDQGDIIPGCPVLYATEGQGDEPLVAEFRPITALVLTQTCDLAQAKTDHVLLCAVWPLAIVVLQEPRLRKEAEEAAKRSKLEFPSLDAPDAEIRIWEIIERSRSLKNEFNAIMKGERPPFAMLAKHETIPFASLSLANFQQVYSLPRKVLASIAQKANPRLRLLPPYREYISHAFARYFSRIGLIQDIPRFST